MPAPFANRRPWKWLSALEWRLPMPRAFVLVLDSVGVGAAPDAASYGDHGADTVGHIAEACASGTADREGLRSGPLRLPNLVRLGLGEACRLSTGRVPAGLED